MSLDGDSDEEYDWKDVDHYIKDGNVPKYVGVEVEEDIDITEGLIKGDDRFQAIVLLLAMYNLMHAVKNQHELLIDYMRSSERKCRSSGCIKMVMKCAVVANAATDSVNRAENELVIDHPHLPSFYHVISLVIFAEVVGEIKGLIEKRKLQRDPHMAFQFVAETVECAFRIEELASMPLILERFVEKSGLQPQIVEQAARQVYERTSLEIFFKQGEAMNSTQIFPAAAAGWIL